MLGKVEKRLSKIYLEYYAFFRPPRFYTPETCSVYALGHYLLSYSVTYGMVDFNNS